MTPEGREKIRQARLRDWQNPDYRARIIAKARLQCPTADQRAKNSEAKKMNWANPQYRARMVEAHKGKKATPETKAKMSKAQIGHPQYNKHKMLRNIEGQFVKAL